MIGGIGDDIVTDLFGDDVLKGGPDDDVISGGPGLDLLQGNAGDDFIVAGNDQSEIFGGSGDDVMYTGDGATESFGGAGDDWIEGGPQLNLLVGDENNQFQDDPSQGHDVIISGKGDNDFDSEGGDDVMIAERPRHAASGRHARLRLGHLPRRPAAGRRRHGGHGRTAVMPAVKTTVTATTGSKVCPARTSTSWWHDRIVDGRTSLMTEYRRADHGAVLTTDRIARITGLAASSAPGATSWGDGNIILGGASADLLEGRGGDDILDGDRWLNVQLTAPNPAGGPALRVNSLQELKTAVFAGQINPGSITYIREIISADSAREHRYRRCRGPARQLHSDGRRRPRHEDLVEQHRARRHRHAVQHRAPPVRAT